MVKIISMVHPFDRFQTFYVYRDGDEIESLTYDLDSFNKALSGLITKYNAESVELAGPASFTKRIAEKYSEYELEKYSKTITNINLI